MFDLAVNEKSSLDVAVTKMSSGDLEPLCDLLKPTYSILRRTMMLSILKSQA